MPYSVGSTPMFGIGMTELLVILVVALVVLGPSRLPEVARSIGRALGELKRQSADVFDEFQSVGREEPAPKRTPIARKPANPPTPAPAPNATAAAPGAPTAEPAAKPAASSTPSTGSTGTDPA